MHPLGRRIVEVVRTKTLPWFRTVAGRVNAFENRHPYTVRGGAAVIVLCFAVFSYFYVSYAMLIEDKLGAGGIRTNSSVYAAPRLLTAGEAISEIELITRLQKAGYTESPTNKAGYYRRTPD